MTPARLFDQRSSRAGRSGLLVRANTDLVRRYTAKVCAGWTVVRFCWEDAMDQPDRVRESLLAVVARP